MEQMSSFQFFFCGELLLSKVGEDQCISGAEMSLQETAPNTQDDADCLPASPLQREQEVTASSVSSHQSKTRSRSKTQLTDETVGIYNHL